MKAATRQVPSDKYQVSKESALVARREDPPQFDGSMVGRTVPGEPRRESAASAFKFILTVALLVAVSAVRTSAADTKQPATKTTSPIVSAAPSFEAFRPIAEQNIFNPNRVGRSARTARNTVSAPAGDSIRFVGTMEYEKGYFAFFDSPNAKFRGVLSQGGVLGDFTVNQVTASRVELTHRNQTLSLQVSQELKRAEGADWIVSAAPAPTEIAASSPLEASTSLSPTDPAPAIPSDASDTLKRLMEQRQKQLKE